MTEQEAKLYLSGPAKFEYILDEYETKLFEGIQFFVNKPPISKVFLARMKKLEKMEEAFLFFGGVKRGHFSEAPVEKLVPGTVKEVFNQYQGIRATLRVRLFQSKNIPELIAYAKQLLTLAREYALFWESDFSEEELSGIRIGSEPDPMEIHRAIVDFESRGGGTFEELRKLNDQRVLKKEAMRWSLWLKNERDGRSLR